MNHEFFFIKSTTLPQGTDFILSGAAPYFVFRVFQFHSTEEMARFGALYQISEIASRVPGYNILICFVGHLEGIKEKPATWATTPFEAAQLMDELISFYEKERIVGKESRQRKYKAG